MSITVQSTQLNAETAQLLKFAEANNLSLSDAAIKLAAQNSMMVKVFLKNGIGLESPVIANDDNFILLNDKKGGFNLVNAEAVSTVQQLQYRDNSGLSNSDLEGKSLRDFALEYLSQDSVHIFLINGVRLDGSIPQVNGVWDDGIALQPLRAGQGGFQVIQWDAIASIQKFDPANINRGNQRY